MERSNDRNGFDGRMPALAPLANPYVPFQMETPPKYDPRKALIRGTMFPGLDLPFMGMVNKTEKPVTPTTDMQTLSFMIQELALYLDTHREDQEALELYHSYQQMYQKCMQEFTEKCGPMNHRTPIEGPYRWLDDPWPWEYARNKEG